MERSAKDTADQVRLTILLKVERSERKQQLVATVMSRRYTPAQKIKLIHAIDDQPDESATLPPEAAEEPPAEAAAPSPDDEIDIEIPPPEPVRPAPRRAAAESRAASGAPRPDGGRPGAAQGGGRGAGEPVSVPGTRRPADTDAPSGVRRAAAPGAAVESAVSRTAARTTEEARAVDEVFEQKSREAAKARKRLFRALPRAGWMRVLRDRSAIVEFGNATGMLRCGLLPGSLALLPDIVKTKVGILRNVECPGLLDTAKPLLAEAWRTLSLAQYNRLSLLCRFLAASSEFWAAYDPAAPVSKQLVDFQQLWPDYLALFVLPAEDELRPAAVLARALKAGKAKESQLGLALDRLATVGSATGDILRAVHVVGWRRWFSLDEVLGGKREQFFLADEWDSPPEVRREIATWVADWRAERERLAVQLREIRRVRAIVPGMPGEGIDRPDVDALRFWHPEGWGTNGPMLPLSWLYEATRQFLFGYGRVLAGTMGLEGGATVRLGVAELAEPVLEITETAKRLHAIKPVLAELPPARIESLRRQPEKGIEAEREALRLSDSLITGFGVLSVALVRWIARDSFGAPAELQEPAEAGRFRRGSPYETNLIADPAECAGKTVVSAVIEAARIALLIPLAMGDAGLLERWHGVPALEARIAGLDQKIGRLAAGPSGPGR